MEPLSTSLAGLMLTLIFLASYTSSQSCIVDNINVMADFDMNKMHGAWYEIYWVPPYFEKPEQVWYDFVEYWNVTNSEDPNIVPVKAFGRPVNETNLAKCESFTKRYEKIEGPSGKWMTPRYINASYTLSMDAWIISTDYSSYSLVYGCSRKAEDGTCKDHHGWIWSRSPSGLKESIMDKVKGYLPSVCLELGDFRAMPIAERPCEVPDNNSSEESRSKENETSGSEPLILSNHVINHLLLIATFILCL